MQDLPDDLYQAIEWLGFYVLPLKGRQDQAQAHQLLHHVLGSGVIAELPEALRKFGRAFQKDIHGKDIRSKEHWGVRRAFHLAIQVEVVVLGKSDYCIRPKHFYARPTNNQDPRQKLTAAEKGEHRSHYEERTRQRTGATQNAAPNAKRRKHS